MRAPEKVLLSVRSAARDRAIRVALQHSSGEPLADRIVLCVHLLLEASKQHDSKWWPYLRSLPTEYNLLGAFPAGLEQAFQVHHPSSFHVHACAAHHAQWMPERFICASTAVFAAALHLQHHAKRYR